MNPTLPPPADFATMAVNGLAILREHYHVGDRTLKRWEAETGITIQFSKSGPRTDVAPPDFIAMQADMTIRQLMAHYDVGRQIIRKWMAETGQQRRRGGPPAVKDKPRTVALTKLHASSLAPVNRPHRDGSRAGMAAEFLRRNCAVYRCVPTGRADQKGSHWRYGNAVLTDTEIIERAERNGWEPDAWKRVRPA